MLGEVSYHRHCTAGCTCTRTLSQKLTLNLSTNSNPDPISVLEPSPNPKPAGHLTTALPTCSRSGDDDRGTVAAGAGGGARRPHGGQPVPDYTGKHGPVGHQPGVYAGARQESATVRVRHRVKSQALG